MARNPLLEQADCWSSAPPTSGVRTEVRLKRNRAVTFIRVRTCLNSRRHLGSITFPEILEDEATGEVKTIYEEIRRTLRVSVVSFFWRSVAVHPRFFAGMWQQVRRNAESLYLEKKAEELQALALLPDSSGLPKLGRRLRRSGWNTARIQEVRDKVDSYRYLSSKLLILVASIGESIDRGQIGGTALLSERIPWGAPVGSKELPMLSLRSSAKELQILEEIKVTHQWHGVASGYRTFAMYPDFLKIVWKDIVKPVVRNAEYNSKSNELYWLSINYARYVPFGMNLGGEWQSSVGIEKAELGEIKIKVALFQRLISDFLIDVQRIKASLDGPEEARESPVQSC